MARPKLSSHEQPRSVRFLLRLYEGLASLKLAVVLIAASAIVLAGATFVEKYFGTEAAQFGVYGTAWFAALNILLGLNVACAALIRFPWKRRQTGFVITHAGILVLLAGCLVTRMSGIDAQLSVYEAGTAHVAFEKSQHFELELLGQSGSHQAAPDQPRDSGIGPASLGSSNENAKIRVPFVSGPFNWSEYRYWHFFPWRLLWRDRGILYDGGGIRLEVLDYSSDADLVPAEPLKLRVKGRSTAGGSSAPAKPGADQEWQTVELGVQGVSDPHGLNRRVGLGGRQKLPGGQYVVFWVARSQAETDAFLDSRPEGPLGEKGQVVLHAGGRKFPLPIDGWQPGERKPLGNSDLAVELLQVDAAVRGIALRIRAPGQTPQQMMLLADYPEFNRQDHEHGVFGAYWLASGAKSDAAPAKEAAPGSLQGLGRPRIDILQGADQKLYYRAWKPLRVEAIAPLPDDGTPLVAFAASGAPVTWYVEEFTPHDLPGGTIRANPFFPRKGEKSLEPRRALVRVTVDDRSERFWLEGLEMSPIAALPNEEQRKVVCGGKRRVAVTLKRDQIDLGFQVRLNKFNRRLDPGSEKVSHYSSEVDLCDRDDPGRKLRDNVLITLNEPASITDPGNGRCYRLYQESFNGPWRPGDPQFTYLLGPKTGREELFLSVLSVNYDPGRGLKYAGTLLIFAGFVIIYYMRAYFFRKRQNDTA